MELKSPLQVLSFSSMLSSNRTFMELKFDTAISTASTPGSNRTFMELKLTKTDKLLTQTHSSNRTFMELKSGR